MIHVVVVADMMVAGNGDTIVTHALGSCLGLMVYDPVAKVGGLLHAMLPLSKINVQKAKENPFMFVDTGVPALFKKIYAAGGQKQRMVVKAAGCGNPLDKSEIFKIGQKNYTLLKKLLWKNGLLLKAEDVGGVSSRTVYFDIRSGIVKIKSCGKETLL